MIRTIALLGISALALLGCDSKDANAQSQVSADVGNPDSANILVIEEGYEVITPAVPSDGMVPDPGNPGVEVAPANDMPAAPTQENMGTQGVTVDESVDETLTPNSATYEVDESVN